jgi:PKD repeat protein
MSCTANLTLVSGWNRIDITGYNQNSGYNFSCGALANSVEIMNHEVINPPVANFTWNPGLGWSGKTAFSFTDASANTPDHWNWDVDNDGIVDYTTQNVSGHTYFAPDGSSMKYSVKLEASRLIFSDEATKTDIITVFGKPLANFNYTATELHVGFSNSSIEPGKVELGGYSYAWDLDNDGKYDDSFIENPEWTFPGAGQYLVGLEVTNGAGSSIVREAVTVPEPSSFILAGMAVIGSLALGFRKRMRMPNLLVG